MNKPSALRVTERRAQRYVGVRELVTTTSLDRIADRIAELVGWLAARGIDPAGPPFLRYLTVDMAGLLDVEAGVPVGPPIEPEGDLFVRTLPSGRYAEMTHLGHPDGLVAATAELLARAKQQGLRWDAHDTPVGERWGCRLEVFLTDPREQPDANLWRTDLVFRLAYATGAGEEVLRPDRPSAEPPGPSLAGKRPSVNLSIDVPDLEAGLRFYSFVFGFFETGRPFSTMAILDADGITVCLHQKAAGSASSEGAPDVRRYDRHWTPVHLDLHVRDLDAVLEKVRAAGGRVERELRNQGPKPVAFCSDPFGNGFCLIGED